MNCKLMNICTADKLPLCRNGGDGCKILKFYEAHKPEAVKSCSTDWLCCPVCGGDEELFMVMKRLLKEHGYTVVET